jgi:hypothetical protein
MAKKQTEATETVETPAPEAKPYRLLVNPSGNVIAFSLTDPAFDYHVDSQRPPGVKPDRWYREATAEEEAKYAAALAACVKS